jgi:hypothetical protein
MYSLVRNPLHAREKWIPAREMNLLHSPMMNMTVDYVCFVINVIVDLSMLPCCTLLLSVSNVCLAIVVPWLVHIVDEEIWIDANDWHVSMISLPALSMSSMNSTTSNFEQQRSTEAIDYSMKLDYDSRWKCSYVPIDDVCPSPIEHQSNAWQISIDTSKTNKLERKRTAFVSCLMSFDRR